MEPPAYIAIHDGARPVITAGTLERLLKHLRAATPLAGVIAAYPSVDTIKLCEPDGTIVQTPPRDALWCVQTPQVFRAAAIIDAHSIARLVGAEGTDDSSLVEAVGGKVACVACPRNNIKLTLPEDIAQVEAELAHLYGAGGDGASSDAGMGASGEGRGEGRSC
jgi:2-C-methyl-D-erythritol 4-phosphate cytidylyltransferase